MGCIQFNEKLVSGPKIGLTAIQEAKRKFEMSRRPEC